MYLETLIFAAMASAATAASNCYDFETRKSFEVSTTAKNLTSPGYPNDYDGNLQCRWLLIATEYIEATVNVTVLSLDLENSTDCEHDSLKIYKGVLSSLPSESSPLNLNNNKQLANLCGHLQTPLSFLAEGIVDIIFTSNSDTNGRGLVIEYQALLDVDEDGYEHAHKTDSWGIILIAICAVVGGVLVITVVIVCIMSKRVKDPKPIEFDSPFGEQLPKSGGVVT